MKTSLFIALAAVAIVCQGFPPFFNTRKQPSTLRNDDGDRQKSTYGVESRFESSEEVLPPKREKSVGSFGKWISRKVNKVGRQQRSQERDSQMYQGGQVQPGGYHNPFESDNQKQENNNGERRLKRSNAMKQGNGKFKINDGIPQLTRSKAFKYSDNEKEGGNIE